MSESCLLISCHPSQTSVCTTIADQILCILKGKNTAVTVHDLAQLKFNPVISAEELETYYDDRIPADLARFVEPLRSAQDLVIIYPVWMYHMPALMKGYFDKVWRPHISFELEGDQVRPLLTNIRSMTVIACHGMDAASCDLVGDGTREFFSTSLPSILPRLERNTRFDLYGLDTADVARIENELFKIRQHFSDE